MLLEWKLAKFKLIRQGEEDDGKSVREDLSLVNF